MIRVMIVDDEPIIRTGLEKVIDWTALGCCVAAVAENGAAAIRLIESSSPQIIVSDIKMPKMDGLELAKRLHELRYDCKIILITGYKEFEYAQKAVRYGVREYVLKPVDHEKLMESIQKLVFEIQAEEAISREQEQLRERVKLSEPLLRDKFLSDLLFRSVEGLINLHEKLEYFGIELKCFRLAVVAVENYDTITRNWTENDRLVLPYMIQEHIECLASERNLNVIIFTRDYSVYCFVDCAGDAENDDSTEFFGVLAEEIRGKCHFVVSVGLSNVYDAAENVYRARREAEMCAAQGRTLGEGSIVCASDLEGGRRDDFDRENIQLWTDALQNGVEMDDALEKLLTELRKPEDTPSARAAVAEILMSSMCTFLSQNGKSEKAKRIYDGVMAEISRADALADYLRILEESCRKMIDLTRMHNVSRNGRIIDRAKEYMRENSDRDISLEDVAAHVFLSKWYFSKLFKRETGENFNECMNALRIERAKQLMSEEPMLKTYEIAERLGFPNVRYFSQLFKNITGMTPSEYRG